MRCSLDFLSFPPLGLQRGIFAVVISVEVLLVSAGLFLSSTRNFAFHVLMCYEHRDLTFVFEYELVTKLH